MMRGDNGDDDKVKAILKMMVMLILFVSYSHFNYSYYVVCCLIFSDHNIRACFHQCLLLLPPEVQPCTVK